MTSINWNNIFEFVIIIEAQENKKEWDTRTEVRHKEFVYQVSRKQKLKKLSRNNDTL